MIIGILLFLSSSNAIEESCSLCPNNGGVSHLHRSLPESALTCLELEELILSNLPNQPCETTRSFYLGTTPIDVVSFCGCQNVPLPKGCPFCHGNLNFPEESLARTANDGNNLACTDIAALATFVTDQEYCTDHIQSFEDSCCPDIVETLPGGSCSICPPGSRMKDPLRKSALLGGKTCASMNSELWFVPEDRCSNRLDELSHGLDMASFCSCEGVEPPSIYSFCDEGAVLVLDRNVDIVAPRSVSGGKVTCQEAGELAPYFARLDDSYGSELGSLASACCQKQQPCSICSDGSSVKFPDRPLEFGRSTPSCDYLETSLTTMSSEECSHFWEINHPVDYESWCGCTNALVPDTCSLCGEGMILINGNVEIADTGGMTCGDAAEYARHVLNLGYCDEVSTLLSGDCCALAPAETTGQRFPEVFVVSEASKSGISSSNYLSLLGMSMFGLIVL